MWVIVEIIHLDESINNYILLYNYIFIIVLYSFLEYIVLIGRSAIKCPCMMTAKLHNPSKQNP